MTSHFKKALVFSFVFIFVCVFVPCTHSSGIQKAQTQMKTAAKKIADVLITGINASPCMCEADMGRYFHSFSPKNLHVYVGNSSAYNLRVRVTVRYFSLYRTKGRWNDLTPREFVLNARKSNHSVVFWSNNFYDIIFVDRDKSKPLTAKIEILDKTVTELNKSNNEMSITACQAYVY
jgi:hypothetical protein